MADTPEEAATCPTAYPIVFARGSGATLDNVDMNTACHSPYPSRPGNAKFTGATNPYFWRCVR